jgi:hypothetical protein
MTKHEPSGPGSRWLAEQAGVRPRKLFADPILLLEALGNAVRDTAELAVESLSPNPVVRRAALDRADSLTSRLASKETPSERACRTVAAALLREADRLRSGAPAVPRPKI